MGKGMNGAPDREIVSYGYDPLGRRISKTIGGQITRYVYEGMHLVAEVAPNNAIQVEYLYGNSIDNPIAMVSLRGAGGDEAIYYYHKDGLGSTAALTDKNGAVVERYKYGPYGEPEITDANGVLLEESALGNNHLYTGQIYDPETGFYYYKARYYSPTLGRFLQRDPLGYVDGSNLYAYVNNNPLNWIDPLGLDKQFAQIKVETWKPDIQQKSENTLFHLWNTTGVSPWMENTRCLPAVGEARKKE